MFTIKDFSDKNSHKLGFNDLGKLIRKEKTVDESYLEIINKILSEGQIKENRTGIPTLVIPTATFEHNMSDGFPILTTKKITFRLIATELEFFIKGITDKKWMQDHNTHIWDEWATPKKVKYGTSDSVKKLMYNERDLGPIYGFQWRHFNAIYDGPDIDYEGQGVDQLKNLVKKLKTDPNDRRMIVSAWNPQQLWEMALPPCHYSFQVTVIENELNLSWVQRSVDTMLGLPFNITSYALLLHLLAKESNLNEGKLTGFLNDVHIYENHLGGAIEQLKRDARKYNAPKIRTEKFSSIFEWSATDTIIENYQSYPKITFDIAV